MLAYTLLNTLPLLGAGTSLFSLSAGSSIEPHPLALMAVEAFALLLIIAARELTITALWSALKRRMNERLGEADRGEILQRDAAWGVV